MAAATAPIAAARSSPHSTGFACFERPPILRAPNNSGRPAIWEYCGLLIFQPRRQASVTVIPAVLPLCDDPFEVARAHRGEQVHAAPDDVIHVD
jgi:hypothetical protein